MWPKKVLHKAWGFNGLTQRCEFCGKVLYDSRKDPDPYGTAYSMGARVAIVKGKAMRQHEVQLVKFRYCESRPSPKNLITVLDLGLTQYVDRWLDAVSPYSSYLVWINLGLSLVALAGLIWLNH